MNYSSLKSMFRIMNSSNISSKNKTGYDKDESRLYTAFFVAVIIGFIIVLVYDGFHKFDGVPVALLWAFPCIASGGITGFLFGVPRVVPLDLESAGTTSGTVINSNNARLSVNTNIEQISDWLTKIIVGLGLVNLGKIPGYLDRTANSLALALGPAYGKGPHAFALALIIYFSIVGFISGYLLTRLYISRLIVSADNQIVNNYDRGEISYVDVQVPNELKNVLSEKELKDILAETPVGPTTNTVPDQMLTVTSRKLSDLNENQISDPVSFAAWATAQLNLGNVNKALDGYRKAISTFKYDAKLRYQYALTLHRLKYYNEAIHELEKALTLVLDKGDKVLQADITIALSFVYLYIDPPKSFEKSIEYGEKYLSNANLPQSYLIWINLASAYGQQATYINNHLEYSGSFEESRKKALNAVQQALILDQKSAATFKRLLQKDIPKPQEENDLEIFENENEFRQLLGLPLI